MKNRILIFGDSNTWGYVPGGGCMPFSATFPGICASVLGERAEILVDGLPGRNAAWDGPGDPDMLGGPAFREALRNSMPLSWAVVMLGTNDLMPPIDCFGQEIANNLSLFVRCAQETAGRKVNILLVSPPPIAPHGIRELCEKYGGTAGILRQNIAPYIRDAAERCGAQFLDGAQFVAQADAADGFHLSENAHRLLGEAVAARLRCLLFPQAAD